MRFIYAALVALCAAGPAAATTLVDGGFETKGAVTPVSSYCYDNGGCAASPWVGSGHGTGVIRSGEGAWGYVVAGEGSYYGFVQQTGVLIQSFVATVSGMAKANWIDTNRAGFYSSPYGGLQSYNVSIFDGTSSVAIGSFSTAIGPWVARTSSAFALTQGATYTLRFTGLAQADSTAFLDDIALNVTPSSAVPEPASWAMLIAGFGIVGTAARRRRVTVAA